MASGVSVSDEVQSVFEAIKRDKKYRFLIFHIKEEKIIEIEKFGDRSLDYQAYLDYLESIGPLECRYGLFDMEYVHQPQGTSDTIPKSKLFLMIWCPDTAKIKKKMLYSSSFDALKQALTGVGKFIQATDMAEASSESVLEKLRATDRT